MFSRSSNKNSKYIPRGCHLYTSALLPEPSIHQAAVKQTTSRFSQGHGLSLPSGLNWLTGNLQNADGGATWHVAA